jgi:hypothetical protein
MSWKELERREQELKRQQKEVQKKLEDLSNVFLIKAGLAKLTGKSNTIIELCYQEALKANPDNEKAKEEYDSFLKEQNS